MFATALILLISWLLYRKVEKMHLFTFVIVTIFGSLTLAFHSDLFIKWKVTLIYTLFAAILLFSQLVMKKNVIQSMMSKGLTLPTHIWNQLNVAWALFFLACGLLNIYVAFWLPQNIWVNFKVFGITGLTLLFTIVSVVYIARYLPKEDKSDSKNNDGDHDRQQ